MTTSSLSVTTDSSTSISTNIGDGDKMAATSTMSQPTALPQGLVPGASQSRPSSDNATSNSVINPSSTATTGAQGADSPWLDSAVVSDWEKQPGSSQPNTPRLDHPNNPVTTSQFTGWGSQPFSSTFSGETVSTAPASKWGAPSASNNNNSNMQSAWGTQSPSLTSSSQQQPSTTSDWGMPTGTPSTTQWGMPSTPVSQAEANSWGQPNMLPNAGTDGWGQNTAAVSSGQTNTPSSAANAQPSQWGQPASHSSSSSASGAWQTSSANITSASNQPVQSTAANTSASTAQQSQWGATTSAATASNPVSPPSTSSATQEATAAPTSWAGAAAKGLPKSLPKPQEPVDPVKVAIEQSINNPDGWGRVPVKQDTSWGQPPDKNKQDESNQWHTTQNNGTAIWETSKNSSAPADKSTWNQKVAGSTDPNVWNGEGSKGNDNALWDNVPKEADNGDKANTWNAQVSQSRTISGSSAGGAAEGSNGGGDSGWASTSASANRSSPPNSLNQQQPTNIGPAGDAPGWSSQNGLADSRKGNRWDSTGGQAPMRMNSMSGEPECDSAAAVSAVPSSSSAIDAPHHNSRLPPLGQPVTAVAVGSHVSASQSSAGLVIQPAANGRGYWDQAQNRPNGPPSNWNSKPSASWSGDSSAPGGNWGHSQSGGHGSWGDGPSWQSGASGRKPSYSWEDSQANGDFNRDRRMKGDGDVADDADMGDWNESNSVWSSARGFQTSRKHTSIPENHMPPHLQSNRMGSNSGHFGGSGMMNPGHGGMAPNANMGSKSQMLSYLVNTMKFPKDEAHSALINNNMNMEAAIAELNKNSMQPMGSRGDFGAMVGGPIGDNAFNPNIPPPNMPSALNTPFTNNAQHNQSAVQGSSRSNKPSNQPRMPGRGGTNSQTLQQQQQSALLKQLEMGVQMNNIHPHILHLPLAEHNLRVIQQLLNLQQSYQHQHDMLLQLQRRHGPNAPQLEQAARVLSNITNQMKAMQQPLLLKIQQNQVPNKFASGLPEAMSGLTLPTMPNAGPQPSSSQSRLGLWTTDKTPGSRQGGVLGDNLWSTPGAGTSASMWPNTNTSNQYLDNQNESHSAAGNGPHSIPSNSTQSFDIPEFVPGVPWQGANSNKAEDDPNLTPGSVARSLSVSTASGRNSTDLGWSSSAASGNKSTWSSQNPSSPAADMWNKSTRPPPGFNKNINRSVSMPQGPSEKTSAFSPVGGSTSWDAQQATIVSGGSPWLLLRNLPPQVDANTLKTLCLQHGPLQSFFVNTNTGQALIRYATKEEAQKAQKLLNSCPMFETTISADFLDDSEVPRIIEQGQRQGNMGRSHSVSAAPGSAMWPNSNSGSSSNLWASNVPTTSSMWGGASGGFLPAAEMGGNNYNM